MTFRFITLLIIQSLIFTSAIPVWARPSGAPAESTEPAPVVEETDPGLTDAAVGDLLLAPGFLIDIRSPQDPSLSGNFRIPFNGTLELPYSMTVDARGMTLRQLRVEIHRLYRSYFKKPTAINVSLKQKRYWIDVRGLITHPGLFLVKAGAPLDAIISLAGGLTDKSSAGFARLEQSDSSVHWLDMNDYYKNGRNDLPDWKGADQLFFQKEGPDTDSNGKKAVGESVRKVQVLGEVKTPGEITYRPGADGYHYLVKTGGPTTQADTDNVELIRADPKTGERKPISVGPVYEMKGISEGDIILFNATKPSEAQKTLQTAAIVTSMATALALAVYLIYNGSKSK